MSALADLATSFFPLLSALTMATSADKAVCRANNNNNNQVSASTVRTMPELNGRECAHIDSLGIPPLIGVQWTMDIDGGSSSSTRLTAPFSVGSSFSYHWRPIEWTTNRQSNRLEKEPKLLSLEGTIQAGRHLFLQINSNSRTVLSCFCL